MKQQERAPADSESVLLERRYRNYLEVAGTNIEDIDRALKTCSALEGSVELAEPRG